MPFMLSILLMFCSPNGRFHYWRRFQIVVFCHEAGQVSFNRLKHLVTAEIRIIIRRTIIDLKIERTSIRRITPITTEDR